MSTENTNPNLNKLLRVGFCSTAGIGRKTWAAIQACGKAVITVVASRDEKKAQQFIDECQVLKPFDTKPKAMPATTEDKQNLYEPLYTSDEVDIIYVPIPMLVRYDVIKNALKNGKHVVTEKPVADSTEVASEMLKLAEENNCLLLDGTMLTHSKRISHVASKILACDDECQGIGKVRSISSVFTFNGGENFEKNDIRCDPKLEPLGCLGDLGWYSIRYAIEALGGCAVVKPLRARGTHIERTKEGVPMTFECSVEFEVSCRDNKSIKVPFHAWTSFREHHQMKIDFRGTHGVLHLDDFCLPFKHPKETTYKVERHSITAVDCQVDHVPCEETHRIHESSTHQEEAKWADAARIFNVLYNKRISLKDIFGQDVTGEEIEQQKKIARLARESFMAFLKMTNEVMVACYESANQAKEDGDVGPWVKF